MIYLLDTNVLSAMRRPERAPQVLRWLAGKAEDDLYLSVVTLGEVERGIARQQVGNPGFAADLRVWLERTETVFADRILPFDAGAARVWGRLSAKVGHNGADLLIAATALSCGAVVVTGDGGFASVGVAVENPFQT